jgi:hypothetical protein
MGSWTNSGSSGITSLFSGGGFTGTAYTTIAAGTSVQPIALADVSGYASYDLNTFFQAASPGSVGAALTVQVKIQWYDDTVSGIPVFQEDWWPFTSSLAAPSQNTLAGCGPMHGQYMTITITNPALIGAVTVQYFNVFGSPRVVPYSDWRQSPNLLSPETNGFTTTVSSYGSAFDNVLAAYPQTPIPGGSSVFLPVGMYAGPVYIEFENTSANAFANDAVLISCGGLVSGLVVAGTSCPNVIRNFSNPSTPLDQPVSVILPRAACGLVLKGGASATGSLHMSRA